MSFPHKDKHTCDICVSSLWGNVCVEGDLVGKKSFLHKEKHTSDTSDNSFYCFFALLCPAIRVGSIKQSCMSDVCLSVAYIVSNSRTQRPWKTKIGTEVTHVTCDSGNSFDVKRYPTACWYSFILSFIHTGIDLRSI